MNSIYQFCHRSYSKDYLWRVSLSGLDIDYFESAKSVTGAIVNGSIVQAITSATGQMLLPAYSVNEDKYSLLKKDIKLASNAYSIPSGRDLKLIEVAFYDTAQRYVENSIVRWSKEIVDRDGYIKPLKQATRDMTVYKLDSTKITFDYTSYSVFPYGKLAFSGTTNPKISIVTVTFVIASDTGEDNNLINNLKKNLVG